MTEPFDEYGDRLRRVLHAEAEAIVPSPEGLDNIRTKIDQRRERQLWYMRPWLRPLAAVSAAIALAIIAVPATAAFRNFVQTGHFSPYGGHDGGRRTVDGQHTYGQVPPGPVPTGTRVSPRPSTGLTSSSGSHVVTGSCPPGEGEVTPAAGPSPSPTPSASPAPPEPSGGAPLVTCKPSASPSNPSAHSSGTPTDSGSPQPPASEPPPGGSVPSPQLSP